ncbi:MAG: hypothetical protein EAZ92_02930 [Candidatus Kapaibacterium sp.]|nr:MAG: hypothetical protein EAZ92_02930 [Candidatus Kapabacteria bacterium]
MVEILREQEDYVFDISEKHNLKALRHELDFKTEEELTKFLDELVELCLIRRFDGKILSHALLKRMARLDAKRESRIESARIAGLASAEKRQQKKLNSSSTDVQRTFNDRSTTVQRTFNTRSKIPTIYLLIYLLNHKVIQLPTHLQIQKPTHLLKQRRIPRRLSLKQTLPFTPKLFLSEN